MADKSLTELSLEELTSELSWAPGPKHYSASAELARRQFEMLAETSRYQIIAAQAEAKAADAAALAAEAAVKGTAAMERNAKYMLASVIVAAVAAIASAVSAVATVHPTWFK